MALVFNPPPNWPAPPAGWTPTPTWRPDPAWGPVPDGWQLWVEEPDPEPIDVDETPLEPLISEESAEALGASEPVAEPTVEVTEAEISAEIPAPVEAVPAEPVVAEQAGAESHEAEPKPMRYLTPVPLQETALPEQVLNPVAEVAPAAPTIPVAPVPADVPAEPAHEAPAESVAPAEPPVVPAEQAPAEASLPHSVESSPLIEFHSSPAQAPEASAPAPADVAAPQAFAGQEFTPQAPAGQNFAGQDSFDQQNPHQGAANSFGGQPDQFQGEQFAPQHGGQPYNPYQPAAQAGQQGQQAQPVAAFNPYVPQMDSAPQREQQNPQLADSEPKKKGAFSGKLLGIIGAALALLIVIILVVVMLLPRGGSDSSDHSKQAAGTSTSASAQSSDGSSSTTAAEAKLPEGEYKEYKETVTEDKKNIDIEKVKGDASKGIVYYEFKPSDDMSSRAYITSLTDKGENSTGLSVIDMTVDRTPIRGTAWLDTTNPSSPTRKLELNGKGEWLIRVYDESSAPNYTKGEKFHTTMNYYAYTYDGGESTMEFEAKGLDSKRGFALMSASRSDLLFGTSVANMKSSMEWKSTGKNFLQVRSTSSADWSISTH